jgi:hypothetical protein
MSRQPDYAKGLGPTSPSLNPGDSFPSEPLAIAISPGDTSAGAAKIQISAAWVKGSVLSIPVR